MSKKNFSHTYRIEVICIGSELLLDRVNTDVNILAGMLTKAGFTINRCYTVGDDKKEIMETVSSALKISDVIFITGGLGPTSDDITRESIAELLKRKLVFSEKIWEEICKRFRNRGVKVFPEINKKQAYIIQGADILKNRVGTAPGLVIKEGKKELVILPGPPAELSPMAEKYIEVMKRQKKGKGLKVYRFGISGVPESTVEEHLHLFMKKHNIGYTILAQPHIIEILIVSSTISLKMVSEIEGFIKQTFEENYLGLNPPTLPEMVGRLLHKKNWKITLAESCTGGLAGKVLTDIPGSSDFFQGSFVVYSNILKKRILKVPKTVIKKYGAVSQETALYMAKGAKKAGKSDVSLSFTGIAGPSGATADKPVGLVYIGVGLPKNKFYTYRFIFSGDRQRIRERAVYQGLDLLRKKIIDEK